MKEEQPATDYLDVVAHELGVRADRPINGPITLQSVVDGVRGLRADLSERAERDEADRDAMWDRDTRSE